MRGVGWIVGVLLAGALGVLATHGFSLSSAGSAEGSSNSVSAAGAVAGQPAPEFTLETATGQTVSLNQFRGKEPVYLNFWTTWCTYCKQEIPEIEQMQQRYGKKIAIYGVDLTGEEPSLTAVSQYASHRHMNYPILLDRTGAVADSYLVHSIPTTVVINREGVVSKVFIGEAPQEQMQTAIEAVIGGSGTS